MTYSEDQKVQARRTDTVDFLSRFEGFNFVKSGNGWRCVEHDSLFINQDRLGWHWNSRAMSGSNAIAFCEKVYGMSFPAAMSCILGTGGEIRPMPASALPKSEVPKEFTLPEKTNAQYSRIFAYLNKSRGIDVSIITQLVKDRKIYQDKNNNAVFVGYDIENVARFACVRGTLTNKPFRGDCAGSDKRFSFSLSGEHGDRVYAFESPIDLLSHATMANIITNNPNAWKLNHRVSLAGTSDVALRQYLLDNPGIKKIIFCLDNDPAGRKNSVALMERFTKEGYHCEVKTPKLKDMNDDLIEMRRILAAGKERRERRLEERKLDERGKSEVPPPLRRGGQSICLPL